VTHSERSAVQISSPIPRGCGAFISHRFLEANILGYRVWGYDPRWTFFPPSLPLLFARARKKADLIHTTPDYAIFFEKPGFPLVITFRNYVLDPFMGAYSSLLQRIHYRTDLRLFTRLAVRRASAVTAVSQATADLVRSDLGFRGPIQVIPNGIDEKIFRPPAKRPEKKTVKVLFSGNPTLRKGANLLGLIAERVDAHAEIVVTGGLRRTRIQCSRRLRYIGRIAPEKMPALYQNVDILLLPTIREGLCRAALEAMSAGLPLITTNASSMPELIHHGKGGFLCRVGDVGGFADAVNILAEDARLRREMGGYNRSRVMAHYTARKMIDAYVHLFARFG
jgi:glycosyltransferase involved in cell wall biosynthesis